MENEKKDLTLLSSAVIIAIGLMIGGYFISQSIFKGRMADRYVTVKGSAETEIVADFASWPMTVKRAGENLVEVEKQIQADIKVVEDFLVQHGIKTDEFEIEDYLVTDKVAKIYADNSTAGARYLIYATILLKTSNIEAVKKIAHGQYLLAQKGIIIGAKYDYQPSGPFYEFTKLNEIKPKLLSEAIKSARSSADQFAIDAGSKISKIKKANQGSLSITPARGAEESEGNTLLNSKALYKRIRAVITLEYFLE